MPFDPQDLKKFPELPGVYLMKNLEGKVLYIGKAKNLRARLRQYFIPGRDGRVMVPYLTNQIESIDTLVVTSEKEALILENNLIKEHQPRYNALLKDDKTFFSLMLNYKHPWPMLRIVRFKGKPPPGNLYFGPYAHGFAARQTLDFLLHLFPLRQCSDRELSSRTRPCILYDLKRCVAPCVNKCSKEEYTHLVEQVTQFLRGHDREIIKDIKKAMEHASYNLEFEQAHRYHKMLHFIEQTLEKQKVEQAGLVDSDVIGLYREADRIALAQLIFREGKLLHSYERFFKHNAQTDQELLISFILQTYGEQEQLPQEILLPIKLQEQELLSQLVSLNKKRAVELYSPVRGNKKALIEMATTNAKTRFIKEKEEGTQTEQMLIAMEETFHLTHYPEHIECFDNSNISGTASVSAMVVFINGKKESRFYRKYKLRDTLPSDDYGALKEALYRRYKRAQEEGQLPDLIIIDGGKGHLNVALSILHALDISTVDVISIAKEEGKHTKGITAEQVFLPDKVHPILLKNHSPLLFFLQRIRDEAHRFAIAFQRQRHRKTTLISALDALPGIGPIKKQRLLKHFGSVKKIFEATVDEWKAIQGITQKDIETLLQEKNSRSK